MMPSSMTHIYFGLDVYQRLPNSCQEKIKNSREYFKLFCQGSDPFMFYHFFLGKKAKEVGKIQGMMHHFQTRDFFLSTIQYIYKNNLINDGEVMSYLYGYICHYYLDYYTHPYIYYKSGKFDKKEKSTYHYNGIHQKIEYMIDMYFIWEKEHIDPSQYRVYQNLFDVNSFSPSLQGVIKESIEKIYSLSNIVPIYLRSIFYMKLFFHYVNYDPYGWKKKIYSLLSKVTPPYSVPFNVLSFHNLEWKNTSYLNLEHHTWCLPWNKEETFTTSFIDLYRSATAESVKTIKIVTEMLEKKKLDQKKLKEIFQDLSFATGRPCQEDLKLQYFEF